MLTTTPRTLADLQKTRKSAFVMIRGLKKKGLVSLENMPKKFSGALFSWENSFDNFPGYPGITTVVYSLIK